MMISFYHRLGGNARLFAFQLDAEFEKLSTVALQKILLH